MPATHSPRALSTQHSTATALPIFPVTAKQQRQTQHPEERNPMSSVAQRVAEIMEHYESERAEMERKRDLLDASGDTRGAAEFDEKIEGLSGAFMWLYNITEGTREDAVKRLMDANRDVIRKLPIGRAEFERVVTEDWIIDLNGEEWMLSMEEIYDEASERLQGVVEQQWIVGTFDNCERRMLDHIRAYIRSGRAAFAA